MNCILRERHRGKTNCARRARRRRRRRNSQIAVDASRRARVLVFVARTCPLSKEEGAAPAQSPHTRVIYACTKSFVRRPPSLRRLCKSVCACVSVRQCASKVCGDKCCVDFTPATANRERIQSATVTHKGGAAQRGWSKTLSFVC